MLPPCIENPKTGKPYSKHKYDNRVSVDTYVRDSYGGFAPYSYRISRKCERCGFRNKDGRY